jgi:RNA polymerase sigma-70 factor (TIGR02943 family)
MSRLTCEPYEIPHKFRIDKNKARASQMRKKNGPPIWLNTSGCLQFPYRISRESFSPFGERYLLKTHRWDNVFPILEKSASNPKSESAVNPERWVDDHGDYLYRYAMIRIRNATLAKDLVQETLLAALRGREHFGGRSSERGWLSGILKNKIMDHYRKLGRETSFTDMEFLADEFSEKFIHGWWIHREGPIAWKPEADVVVHRDEFWAVMRDCLGKLPSRISSVFMLREMEGLTTREICKSLSVTENNIWVMLHRARMALRECLEVNWFKKSDK